MAQQVTMTSRRRGLLLLLLLLGAVLHRARVSVCRREVLNEGSCSRRTQPFRVVRHPWMRHPSVRAMRAVWIYWI